MRDSMIDYSALASQLDDLLPKLRAGTIDAINYGRGPKTPWYDEHSLRVTVENGQARFCLLSKREGQLDHAAGFHIGTSDADLKAELHRLAQHVRQTSTPPANVRGLLRRSTLRNRDTPLRYYAVNLGE